VPEYEIRVINTVTSELAYSTYVECDSSAEDEEANGKAALRAAAELA
jgi:hypothetical protein